MPDYSNGNVPSNLLVTFNRGHNDRDGHWSHSFPPATYARHLELVRIARSRTGRPLALGYGWTAYRPLAAQRMLKQYYTSIGKPRQAADQGTSSHGGFWERKQTMAGDYGNWDAVYGGFGGRAAFAEDCRKAGLLPNMIVPARGYPDEPWHVIDPNPWSAVPAFAGGAVLPFHPEIGEDMSQADIDWMKEQITSIKNAIGDPSIGILGAANTARDHAVAANGKLEKIGADAGNAASIASDVRNLILDPDVGVLQALRAVAVGAAPAIDYEKLAAALGESGVPAPDAEAIASAVRAKFKSEPLS